MQYRRCRSEPRLVSILSREGKATMVVIVYSRGDTAPKDECTVSVTCPRYRSPALGPYQLLLMLQTMYARW